MVAFSWDLSLPLPLQTFKTALACFILVEITRFPPLLFSSFPCLVITLTRLHLVENVLFYGKY